MAKYLGIPLQVASGTTVTPTYGSPDLVVDGDFPAGTDAWVFAGGATLESDGAQIDNTVTGANAYISQELTNSPNGKRFELTYDVIATNGTTLALELLSNLNLNTETQGINRKITFTWDKVSAFLTIKRISAGTNVTIDNVSLKEVPYVLGKEQVVDGDFPTGTTAWQLINGATISGNKANIIGDGSTFTNIKQTGVFENGKVYQIVVDVTITSGLGLKFQDGVNNENIGFADTTGVYTFNFTGTSYADLVIGRRTGGTAFDSSVNSVSVKEVQYNYLQVVGGDLLKESKVGDVVFNSTDDNEAVVLQVIDNDTLLLSNDVLSDAGDAFSIFAPNGDTRGNQILRIDNYIISEYDEASSLPDKSSFWFAAGPQADKVTLTQLNDAVNTYFVADVIERFVQRLNAQSATASRLDIPLNEFRDHKYNQVLTTTAITLS